MNREDGMRANARRSMLFRLQPTAQLIRKARTFIHPSAHDFTLDLLERDVTYILALDHIDNVLGDIFCVVADALNRLGNEQYLNGNRYGARIFHHESD